MANKLIFGTILFLPILSGCNVSVWGNLAVLAVSVGIFVGTISLGRVNKTSKGPSPSAQSKEPS